MKTTLVITVLNEVNTIKRLLDSISYQTKKPDEIVIVDGGSTDGTKSEISNFSNKKLKTKLLQKKGNRSIGRNEGIKKAFGDLILITDAGCVLDKNWVKNITEPFKNPSVDVVAGYYKGISKTIFQKCLVPYVLIMPDKLNKNEFLPASRSMAFRKPVWKKVGGFPNYFSHNEDYVFAQKLKKIGVSIMFKKKAIVYWVPRENIVSAFWMFFCFATGDAEAFLFRPKVLLIFLRYMLGIFLLFYYAYTHQFLLLITLLYMIILYYIWALMKNYKYVKDRKAFFVLPLLQFASDIAVITGTLTGVIKRLFL